MSEDVYFHNFDSPKGNCQYIWVRLRGEANTERMALVDTGAGMSIIPLFIYEQINNKYKSVLRRPDMRIWAGNSTKVDVRGMTNLTLDIHGSQLRHKFYVCSDTRHVILGYDFQKNCKVHLEPGENKCWIKERGSYREIPCFDSREYRKASKVAMFENFTMQPYTESIISAELKRSEAQKGKTLLVKKTVTGFELTGALVCNTITIAQNDRVPLRLINATNEKITLHKGQIMAVAEPVYLCSYLAEDEPTTEECECECPCNAN